jgi:hypothetical protein
MTIHPLRPMLLAAALAVSASPAIAQGPLIESGTRLRATTLQNERVIGRALPSRGDSLILLQTEVGLAEFRLAELERIDVFAGRSHLAGARIGAIRGALIGAVLVLAMIEVLPDDTFSVGRQFELVGRWALVGGVSMGTIGFLVGADVWTEIHPENRARR